MLSSTLRAEACASVSPREVLHGHEVVLARKVLDLTVVEQHHDVRVLEFGEDAGFLQKPAAETVFRFGLHVPYTVQDFHGNGAIEWCLGGEIHVRHAAARDALHDVEAAVHDGSNQSVHVERFLSGACLAFGNHDHVPDSRPSPRAFWSWPRGFTSSLARTSGTRTEEPRRLTRRRSTLETPASHAPTGDPAGGRFGFL